MSEKMKPLKSKWKINKLYTAIFLILVISSGVFYDRMVLAVPAPTNPSVIEPGSLHSPEDYMVYFDNNNVTILAKNAATGRNDCSGFVADIVIQCALTNLSN